MANYDIYANITANTKGYEAGIKKAQESTKKFSTSVSNVIKGLGKSGLVGALGAVGLASAGVTATLGAVVKIVKRVSQSIGECTEAFRTQTKVETALAVSIQNNPLVDGTASVRLKNFASEMQNISDIGDEQLIPMMSDLIAKGRTETETMQIIKVATDMASTGTISFENAVSQLNATLNGNIGRLGQQNAELKTLTEEELKSGKAVEILGQKYNGLAQATADSNKQLKNAIGDLKENLGAVFEKGLDPMRRYFAEVIGNINQAISSSREFKQAMKDVFEESGEVNLTQTSDKLKTALDATINAFAEANMNYKQYLELYGAYIDEETDATAIAYRNDIAQLKEQARQISDELLRRQKESQTQTQARKDAEEQAKKEKEIADLKDEYLEKIAMQEAKWEHIKEVTGEAVGNEEKIKFYQDALVDVMTRANGEITTENDLYKKQIKIIEKLQAGLQPEEKKTGNEWEKKLREQLIARLEADKEEKLAEVENSKMASWQKEQVEVNYNEQLKALKLEALEIEKQEALDSVKDLANADEERLRIQEYYENEKFNLILEYAKKNKEAGKVASDSFVDGFKAVTKKEALNKMASLAKNYANQMASIFSKMAKTIGNVFKEIAGFMKSAFSQIKGTMGKLFKFDTNDALDSLLKFEDSILTFFVETLPQMPQFLASAFQSIEVLIDTLEKNVDFDFIFNQFAGVFGDIGERVPKLMSNISSLLNRLLKSLNSMLQGNMKGIVSSINNILNSFLQTLPQITNNIFSIFNTMLTVLQQLDWTSIFANLGTAIQTFLQTLPQITNNIFSIFNTMLTGLQQLDWTSIFANLGTAIQTFFDNLPTTLTNLIGTLSEIIKGILDSNFIPTVFDGFGDAICEFLGNTDQLEIFLESLMTLIGKLAGSMLSNAGKIFGKLIEDLPEIIGVILKTLPDILADVIGGAFDGVVSILKGTANLLIKGINFVVDALNAADFLDLFSDIPHIPELATGTDNAKRGLTLVGEAGPELVNFRGGEQVLNAHNTQKALAGMGSGGNTFNVTFNNTMDTTAYAMMSQLKQYNRQMAINSII